MNAASQVANVTKALAHSFIYVFNTLAQELTGPAKEVFGYYIRQAMILGAVDTAVASLLLVGGVVFLVYAFLNKKLVSRVVTESQYSSRTVVIQEYPSSVVAGFIVGPASIFLSMWPLYFGLSCLLNPGYAAVLNVAKTLLGK